MTTAGPSEPSAPELEPTDDIEQVDDLEHATLKYSLLGPSLLKAGQDSVDQSKACSISPHPGMISNLTCSACPSLGLRDYL